MQLLPWRHAFSKWQFSLMVPSSLGAQTAIATPPCLSSNDLAPIETLGMDDAVGTWISFLPCEAGAGEESKSNPHVSHVQQSLLQAAVASTPEVPGCPVGGAAFLLSSIEDPLDKGLPSEVILLLVKVGRDASNGRDDANGLMESNLDWRGSLSTSTEETVRMSPLLKCGSS